MIDCALVSADEAFRHTVLGLVRDSESQVRLTVDLQASGDELSKADLEKVIAASPRLIFLDLGESPGGVDGIRVLSQEMPDVPLVVAGPALSAEGLLSVIRAGASEYLPRPFSSKETSEAFSRVRRKAKPQSTDSSLTPGRVITVFSAKGGTGVTSIAINLGIGLRMVTGKRVLVLDPVLSLGTASVAMGLQPRYSFFDVIQNFHRIDEELFRSFLDTHDSGVELLGSPIGPTGMPVPTADDIHGLFLLCKQHFDYVVVDGGNSLSEYLVLLLEESDDRLPVVTPELSSLRNLKHTLDLYGRMNGKSPPRVVLNQYRENLGLSKADVEDGLGERVTVVLEKDDARVLQSINLGRPEVQFSRSRFARNLMKLASELAGPDRISAPSKGFLARFRRTSTTAAKGGKERT